MRMLIAKPAGQTLGGTSPCCCIAPPPFQFLCRLSGRNRERLGTRILVRTLGATFIVCSSVGRHGRLPGASRLFTRGIIGHG